jgi:hypothetical protein
MLRSLLGNLPGSLKPSAKRFWNAVSGERNRFFYHEWILEPLLPSTCLEAFNCGNNDLDEFFQKDALVNETHLLGKSYVLTRDKYRTSLERPPIALICLCNGSIHMSQMENFEKQKGVTYYEYLPAAKIARLGVHKDFQGNDIGHLVMTMIKSIFLTKNRTGCRILTVDAYKDPRVVKFYKDNEFSRIPETSKEKKNETWTMYYDLKRFNDTAEVIF